MALSAKLVMRQGQTLVMTPQLLQAIKLLQLSNVELASFIEEELERNPLLERIEERPRRSAGARPEVDGGFNGEPSEHDWSSNEFATNQAELESSLGTEFGNTFDGERAEVASTPPAEVHGLSATSWTGTGAGSGDGGDDTGLEGYLHTPPSLHDHLGTQLALVVSDAGDRLIGQTIIDGIDDGGYLREPLDGHCTAAWRRPVARGADARNHPDVRADGSWCSGRGRMPGLAAQGADRLDPAMQAL